ncbi:hypothetical protein D3C87_1660020 [compost metagenome]
MSDDSRAAFRQSHSNLTTDTSRGTCDQRNFIVQSNHLCLSPIQLPSFGGGDPPRFSTHWLRYGGCEVPGVIVYG